MARIVYWTQAGPEESYNVPIITQGKTQGDYRCIPILYYMLYHNMSIIAIVWVQYIDMAKYNIVPALLWVISCSFYEKINAHYAYYRLILVLEGKLHILVMHVYIIMS